MLQLAGLAGLIWTACLAPKRDGPGRLALIGLLFTSGWWSVCDICQHLPLGSHVRIVFGRLVWFGTSATPGLFCLLLWNTTFLGRRPVPRGLLIAGLTLVAAFDACAVFNPGHLFYVSITPIPLDRGVPLYVRGPLWYGFVALLFAETLATIAYTAARQRGRSPRRRRIYLGTILIPVAPMITGAVDALGIVHFGADPSPSSFLISAPILAWLLTRNQLCDPMPIARSALLDVLPDAVIVLDASGCVAEANPAARRLPGMPARLAGAPTSALADWSRPIAAALEHRAGAPMMAKIPLDPPRYYELTATSLEEDGIVCGALLVLRDMTRRETTESRLRTALGELNDQLTENLRLQGELRGEARRDPLTNLLNRRALDESLPALLADAARAVRPFAAVMIDIDHFKMINDQFGHGVGDQVLQAFARRLESLSRPGDVLFRVGGEEFLALLPNTRLGDALELARRWLGDVRAGVQVDERLIHLTFSAGIAAATGSAIAPGQLIAHADAAAYRAKREGRDRIVAYDPAVV
jgi:diguanylate cyclase (GGDEF)-like protein